MLLLVVMLFGTAAALFVYGMVDTNTLAIQRDKNTAAAFADIKLALIGYAANDATRPGELPCPDVNNDGQLVLGIDYTGGAGAPCVNLLGRIPWKTLGLPDLRDGSGERFWYALSDNFHAGATAALNSDTIGQLSVNGDAPATNVVAIVFSPGEVLGTQVRNAANENNVANYLEGENANGNTTYTTGAVSATFNDRLLVITTAALMPPVEQRVARELLTILQTYKDTTACACVNLAGNPVGNKGCYPFADWADRQSDAPPYWPSGEGRNRGRIPVWGAAPHDWGAYLNPGIYPSCPPSTYVPTLPAWFDTNNWWQVVYYSAGRHYLGPGTCSTCTPSMLHLTVDVIPKQVVILMPGPLLGNPPRAPVLPENLTFWQYYFEDPVNSDFANDVYVTPTATAYTRDRIFTIP